MKARPRPRHFFSKKNIHAARADGLQYPQHHGRRIIHMTEAVEKKIKGILTDGNQQKWGLATRIPAVPVPGFAAMHLFSTASKSRLKSLILFAIFMAAAACAPCAAQECGGFNSCFDAALEAGRIADYDTAIRLFTKAYGLADEEHKLVCAENTAVAYYNRGNIFKDALDYEAAIEDYDKAVKLKPDLEQAFFNRAFAHRQRADYAAAVADYNRALKLDPGDAMALNNRAVAYFLSGDYGNALADVEQAADLAPDRPLFRLNRAMILMAARSPQAPAAAAAVIDNDFYSLTQYEFLLEAVRLYDHAMETTAAPPAADTMARLASDAYDAGRYTDAASYYTALDLLSPGVPNTAYNLALCYRRLGHRAAAVQSFYHYLYLQPAAPDRTAVLEKIAALKNAVE